MAPDITRRILARWSDADPKYVPLLVDGHVQGVILPAPHEAFERACRQAGIEPLASDQFEIRSLRDFGQAPAGKIAVLKDGLWPGITRGPAVEGRGDETASASREPWVDSNGYRVSYLRTLYPDRPALLGYEPKLQDRVVPFDSLELALIEAWDPGGNYLLTFEPRFRQALLEGDQKAREALRRLGRTAAWLEQHADLFGQPLFATITLLIEEGRTAEIANLMFRRGVSPSLARADQPPPPEPARLVLVAVDIRPLNPALRDRILAHAAAGASVVVNGSWWRGGALKPLRKDEDRDVFALGRGQIIAYRTAIADPSEFAMDVIDIVTHRRRPVRIWNAPAAIATATGKGLLHCINYGSPVEDGVQARIQGRFTRATLLRPERPDIELRTARRGSTTEVMIPELNRLAVVVFK